MVGGTREEKRWWVRPGRGRDGGRDQGGEEMVDGDREMEERGRAKEMNRGRVIIPSKQHTHTVIQSGKYD